MTNATYKPVSEMTTPDFLTADARIGDEAGHVGRSPR